MKGPKRLRSLAANWKLKLSAFALALLLWIFVSADKVTTAWIWTPLEVQLRDADWELVGESVPADVQVRFSGPGRELWDLALEQPRLILRIPSVEAQTQIYAIDPSMVTIPGGLGGVRALDVRPGSVRLRFDRLASKEVPVRVAIGRGPRASYLLRDSLFIEPATVRVSGPAQAVARVEAVITRPIDLSGSDSAFTIRVKLDATQAPGVRFSSDEVAVSGTLDRVIDRVLPSVALTAPFGLRIEPASVEVRLRGTVRSLQAVDPAEISVSFALDSLPEPLPADGLVVPLRSHGVPQAVSAVIVPATARLFPAADTSAALPAAPPTERP